MLDWAKAFHEAIGIESPKAFIVLFAVIGLVLFGLAGWLIDKGYRVKLHEQAVALAASSHPPQSSSPADAPKQAHAQPAVQAVPQAAPTPKKQEQPKQATVPIQTFQGGNYAPGGAIQDNRGSKGNNTQVVNLRPQELLLSQEQQDHAASLLREHKGAIRLVLSSRVQNMADGNTTKLGEQMLAIFSGWDIQPLYIGTGPIPSGITIVGAEADTKTVRDVFDAVLIPYNLVPSGYIGPTSMGTAPLTITVSRTAE